MTARKMRAVTLTRRLKSLRKLDHIDGGLASAPPLASCHASDSSSPWRIHQVTRAMTTRWAKTMREPSRPSGASAAARPNPMKGPKDQASWVAPMCLPRSPVGANSAM